MAVSFFVFNSAQIDKDKDGFVSMDEFLRASKTDEFEKDDGWKSVEEEHPYTDDELAEFEKQLREEEERQKHVADAAANVASKLVKVGVHISEKQGWVLLRHTHGW